MRRRSGVLPAPIATFDTQEGDRVQLAIARAPVFFRARDAGHDATVGKDAESVGHVEERHLATAQGQAQAVIVQVSVQGVDAQAMGRLDDIVHAHPIQHLDGRDVVRTRQGLAEPLRAVVAPVIVLRRVEGLEKRGAHVHHQIGRRVALRKGSEIVERLEGRAGLVFSQRVVYLAVNLLVPIVQAAHHDQDFGRARVYDHHGRIGHILFLLLKRGDVLPGNLLDLGVKVQVYGGNDAQPAPIDQVVAEHLDQLFLGKEGEMGRLHAKSLQDAAFADLQFLAIGRICLFRRDIAFVDHSIQGDALALPGLLPVVNGIVGRRLGNECQHGTFGQIQLPDVFAKVHLRRRLDAGGQVAVKVGVEIPLENLILFKTAGDLGSQNHFFDFASVRLFIPLFKWDEHIFDQLHRNRRSTTNAIACEIIYERLDDALRVKARVGVKGLVFQGDDGILKVLWYLIEMHVGPVAERVDDLVNERLAGAVVELGGLKVLFDDFNLIGGGQVLGKIGIHAHPRQSAGQHGKTGHQGQDDEQASQQAASQMPEGGAVASPSPPGDDHLFGTVHGKNTPGRVDQKPGFWHSTSKVVLPVLYSESRSGASS